MSKSGNKRTQMRGICIYCGKEHAVQGGYMVAHGYTLEWGQQLGNCAGVRRVHLGHKDAPSEIMNAIKLAEVELSSLKAEVKEQEATLSSYVGSVSKRRDLERALARNKRSISMIPVHIERLKTLRINWEEKPLRLVDLDVEEAEERKARQEAAKAKKADRAAKDAEKARKALEREEKAAKKWAAICAENLHIIELDGEIADQWVAEYSSRDELERDHGKRFSAYTNKKYEDTQDRINAAWRCIHRVREQGGRQKQLHKW